MARLPENRVCVKVVISVVHTYTTYTSNPSAPKRPQTTIPTCLISSVNKLPPSPARSILVNNR